MREGSTNGGMQCVRFSALLAGLYCIFGCGDAQCVPRAISLDKDHIETMEVSYAYKCILNLTYPAEYKYSPPARITVESLNDVEHPIVFVVYNQNGVMTWDLPYHLENLTYTTNKEYGVPPMDFEDTDFTATEPWYYHYDWPNSTISNVSSLLLRVDSMEQNDTCMTLSIQNKTCPLLDTENTVVQEGGYFQTIDWKGGLIINKKEFPFGFYLVFIVNGDDDKCTGLKGTVPDPKRYKRLTFILTENKGDEHVVTSLLIPFLVYPLLGLISYIIYIISRFIINILWITCKCWYVCCTNKECSQPQPDLEACETPNNGENSRKKDKSRQKRVMVADLSTMDSDILKRKSQAYRCQLITVAVFYTLPVAQLMLTFQLILKKIGNQDECYYNYLCAHPVNIHTVYFSDFNHLFSNVGYILLGVLFCFMTWRRQHTTKTALDNAAGAFGNQIYGIPENYGHFYAIGLALFMEGILSGLYHLSPNQVNFQFDTSFMYIMTVLCMTKMYTNRHPDISPSSYTTFFALAGIIFSGMIGMRWNSTMFRVMFTIGQLLLLMWLSLGVYSMGQEPRWQTLKRINLKCSEAEHCNRLILLCIGNGLNYLLVILLFTAFRDDFGSYLLCVLIINLILYFVYYIVMKYVHKEGILWQTWIYLVLAGILLPSGAYFFANHNYATQDTPAISRHKNMECRAEMLHFYDNHDLWHFLSAGGLFFTFMSLLTMDDDVLKKKRTEIVAF